MQDASYRKVAVRFLVGFTGLWAVSWLLHTWLLALGAAEAFARLVVTAAYWLGTVGLLLRVLTDAVERRDISLLQGRERIKPRGAAMFELARGFLWRALVLKALTEGLFLGLASAFGADTMVLSIVGDFAVAVFALCWLLESPMGRVCVVPGAGAGADAAGASRRRSATSATAGRPATLRP